MTILDFVGGADHSGLRDLWRIEDHEISSKPGAYTLVARGDRTSLIQKARSSIVKRASGSWAIIYYVNGVQKWKTIGPVLDARLSVVRTNLRKATWTWLLSHRTSIRGGQPRKQANIFIARLTAGKL